MWQKIKLLFLVVLAPNIILSNTIFEINSQQTYYLAGAECSSPNEIPLIHPCIPNSNCLAENESKAGYCICEGDLIPNHQRFCYLPLNTKCNIELDLCNPIQFLTCSETNGVCDCPLNSFYENGACVLKAYTECKVNKQACGLNSECKHDGESYKCLCNDFYTSNEEGQCKLPWGILCKEDKECLEPLICNDGTCICPNNDNISTWYDQNSDTCYLKANTNCTINNNNDISDNNGISCTINSECSELQAKCICQGERTTNAIGQCILGHGKYCEGFELECDESIGLICQENVCQCPYGSLFDGYECKLIAGSLCINSTECLANSECLKMQLMTTTQVDEQNVCICVNETILNSDGFCVLDFGKTCYRPMDCDMKNGLTCSKNNICTCMDGLKYSNGSCLSLEGSNCGNKTVNCVFNADCTNGSCQCQSGYEGSECKPSFGSKCNDTTISSTKSLDSLCAMDLPCVGGICVCPSNQQFTPKHGCLPSIHQPCRNITTESELQCGSSLVCSAGNNTCECPLTHQVYIENQCTSLVGDICSEKISCINHSYCIHGLCKCETNYTMSTDKMCVTTGNFVSDLMFKHTKGLSVFVLIIQIMLNSF